jgi:hypothetical protein
MSPQFYHTLHGSKPEWLPDVKPKMPELGEAVRRKPGELKERDKRILRAIKGRMRTLEICAKSHMSRTVVYNWLVENDGILVQKHKERGGTWFEWSGINEKDDQKTGACLAAAH